MDRFLREVARAMRRVQNNELPDGSGDPIGGGGEEVDLSAYLYLPGRAGGQQVTQLDASPAVSIKTLNSGSAPVSLGIADSTGGTFYMGFGNPNIAGGVYLFSSAFPGDVALRVGHTINSINYIDFKVNDFSTPSTIIGRGGGINFEHVTPGTNLPLAIAGTLSITSTGTSHTLVVQRGNSATPDIQQWKDHNGVVLSYIDNDGTLVDPQVMGGSGSSDTLTLIAAPSQSQLKLGKDDGGNTITSFTSHEFHCAQSAPAYSNYGIFYNHAYALSVATSTQTQFGRIYCEGTSAIGGSTPILELRQANASSSTVVLSCRRQSASQISNIQEWCTQSGTVLSYIDRDGTFNGPVAPAPAAPVDLTFRVVGDLDATKELGFDVDTNVPTGTTVLLIVPAASGTMALLGLAQSWDALQTHINTGADATVLAEYRAKATQTGDLMQFYNGTGTKTAWFDLGGALRADSGVFAALAISGSGTVGSFFATLLTADRDYELPDTSGTFVLSNVSTTLISGASSTFISSTASVGAAFRDTTTDTKRLRMVLSGAVGNNAFIIATTAARQYTFPDATDTVALVGFAQTLTSKTLSTGSTGDINFGLICSTAASGADFRDTTTATKKLRVVLSGSVGNNSFVISSTAARAYTFPDSDGTVTLVDMIQTLTNKTLTSPAINTATFTAGTFSTMPTLSSGAGTGLWLKSSDVNGLAAWTAIAAADVSGLGSLAALSSIDASYIANRTRSIFHPATAHHAHFGAAATDVGTVPNASYSLAMVDAGTGSGHTQIQVPYDYVSGGTIKAVWAPTTTNTGNCRLEANYLVLTAGILISATGTTIAADIAASGTVDGTHISTIGSVTCAAGNVVRVNIQRNGTHANDTFTGTASYLGFIFEYTADS